MIRVSVLYPNNPDGTFDHEYYAQNHIPLAREKLAPFGLVRVGIDRGISGGAANLAAPFVATGYLIFDSMESCQAGLAAAGAELVADVPNYTNIKPQFQISEMVEI